MQYHSRGFDNGVDLFVPPGWRVGAHDVIDHHRVVYVLSIAFIYRIIASYYL